MREFVEYVAEKPDGKDALTILEQRISDQRKTDLKEHNEELRLQGRIGARNVMPTTAEADIEKSARIVGR